MQVLLSVWFINIVWYPIFGICEKFSYLLNKKVRKKNQIPEYYTFSHKELMEIIREQSIDEKPPNLIEFWGKKPKNPNYIW